MKPRRIGEAPGATAKVLPAKSPAARPRAKTRTRARHGVKPDSVTAITQEEFHRMIANAAYYRAEKRGFATGHEMEDWIEAEAEIRRRLEHGPS